MKDAAPSNSPIARLPASERIALNVANTSGEPFPKARSVTPATLSSNPSKEAIVARFGQKKSEALMPRVLNMKRSQMTRPANMNGRAFGEEQK